MSGGGCCQCSSSIFALTIVAMIFTGLAIICTVGFVGMTVFVQYFIGWHYGDRRYFEIAHICVSGSAVLFSALATSFWLIREKKKKSAALTNHYFEVAT